LNFPQARALFKGLQFLARLEANRFARGNCDFGACPGIAADPSFARPNVKNSKTPEFNSVSVAQRFLHGFENGLNSHFRLGFRDPGTTNDLIDNV